MKLLGGVYSWVTVTLKEVAPLTEKNEAFREAIIAAKKEIDEINEQLAALDPLLVRKTQLQSFIATGEALCAKPEAQTRFPITNAFPLPTARIPLWKHIKDAIDGRANPMSAKEVLDVLVSRNVKVKGDFPAETVRGAMLGKPQLFEKQADGKFVVRPIGQTKSFDAFAPATSKEALQ